MKPIVMIALVSLHSLAGAKASQDDVGPQELVFGMSTALTGPAADLGANVRDGVLAAFQEVNAAGGIRGRALKLICLDDGYEPSLTAPNMRELIEQHHVLGVIGNVGTPTAVAAIPIAQETGTPFFGAFTGAGVLRKDPPDRFVVNYRASYAEETAAMVDAMIDVVGLSPQEIGFFTQRDAYGDAGFVGGISALKRHDLTDVGAIAHGRYERNTLAIEPGLADILGASVPVRAVILVGAYAPCAKFIKMAKDFGLDVFFLNVSFVGTAPLARALGEDGDGVIITQVVPHPEQDLPITRVYRNALHLLSPAPDPTFGSLEGYVAARVLCRALTTIDSVPTRNSVIDALENLEKFDLGLGTPLYLDETDHQASHKVWPTILKNGKAVSLDWPALATETQED